MSSAGPPLEQLRVLGAPQRYIMSLVWCIVMTVVAAGTASGLVLGFIGAEAAAHLLAAETGVAMSPAMGSPELRRRGHAPCGFVLRPHSRMARGEAPHPLSASPEPSQSARLLRRDGRLSHRASEDNPSSKIHASVFKMSTHGHGAVMRP